MIGRFKERIASLLLAFVFIIGAVSCDEPKILENVNCDAHVDYVPTDPDSYRYIPMYVEIKRCHGKHLAPNPKNMKCVPKANGVQKVDFHAMSVSSGAQVVLSIDNHTACSQECVISQANCTPFERFNSAACDCTCNVTSSSQGKSLCEAPFVWTQSGCNCMCPKPANTPCGVKRQFNTDLCRCTCSARVYNRCARKKLVVDENTCMCVEPTVVIAKSRSGCEGGVNGAMLAVVIVVEAVLIVFFYYFFYVYCYRHNYLGRKNKPNISSGYYHNGDIPTDTVASRNGNGNRQLQAYGGYDNRAKLATGTDDGLSKPRHHGLSDKEIIALEEEGNGDYMSDYSNEEKTRLAPRQNDGEYYYNDIMEVDGPPSSLDNHNLNMPPDYSDAISDLSAEGSVTQV